MFLILVLTWRSSHILGLLSREASIVILDLKGGAQERNRGP